MVSTRWWKRKHGWGFLVIATLVLLLLICVVSRVFADVRISYDPGGELVRYVHHYERLKQERHYVTVDGRCYSACTLVLMLPDGQRCATVNAEFYFHAAYIERQVLFWKWREIQQDQTDYMFSLYPRPVRAWVITKGGLGKNHVVMRQDEIYKYMRACK